MSYTWEIGPLDVRLSEDGMTNVVHTVHWRLVGRDGNYVSDVYGTCAVPAPTPDDFTPYDQLTKTQVELWLVQQLGVAQVAAYSESIARNIELQKNPVDAQLQPPWVD